MFLKKILFFFCVLFLCISCTSTSQLLFNGSGATEIRKNIARIEGAEQSIENATSLIESYSSDIEGSIEDEGGLIEELRRLLQRIRERGDGSPKKAIRKD